VQITIDTLKDSKDDIRKAIRLLMSLAAESSYEPSSRNIFDSPSPSLSAEPVQQAAPAALGSFFDAVEQQPPASMKKDKPQVEFY
jgi:hypothetical protein